jgi:hypothetical protein
MGFSTALYRSSLLSTDSVDLLPSRRYLVTNLNNESSPASENTSVDGKMSVLAWLSTTLKMLVVCSSQTLGCIRTTQR